MSQIGVILKAMVAVLVLVSVVVGISESALNVEGKNSVGLASLHLNAPRNFVTGPIPSQVIPMDLDGDGDLDVAVKCSDVLRGPQLQLFENPGDGTLVLHSWGTPDHVTKWAFLVYNRDFDLAFSLQSSLRWQPGRD
jgi:hypothetical protein